MNVRAVFGSILAGAATFGAIALQASPASACGGFFCDSNQPVNQAAERIIFSDNADGTVTAVVQILYQGPAENFAWVLPVPSVPDTVDVSSNAAFVAIQRATNPVYRLDTTVEGECDTPGGRGVAFSADSASDDGKGGSVTVLAAGNVGPYDWVVIDIAEDAMDKVQIALDWLTMNGFDLTELGPDVIAPYIEDGMKLMAFKLSKSADDGDIRPIRITYESDTPMIPIKLTAVAANDDMGVLTWVLGEERAVPVNYKDLVLNEALINWLNPGPTYNDVVIAAADEAGGQGFVTEYAGDTEIFADVVFSKAQSDEWDAIRAGEWAGREAELLDRVWLFAQTVDPVSSRAVPWDGMAEVLDAVFPLLSPTGRQLFLDEGPGALEPGSFAGMNFEQFFATTQQWVVGPMIETQELLESRPYATRMYTTLSAAEMTLDPVFDFNPDLDDWSNVHVGSRVIECHRSVLQAQAPWRATLPSGLVVRGEGGGWPIDVNSGMPVNLQIAQAGTSGPSEVLTDNRATILDALEAHNATILPPSGCGCNAASGGRSVPFEALLFFGFLAARRRRRP